MRKTDKRKWAALTQRLNDFKIEAGWFENNRYENGISVAEVARVQNYGAVINNPGGQPYIINKKGQIVFVSKSKPNASNLPKTKPHIISIPPRPFMDNAKQRVQGQEGYIKIAGTIRSVFDKEITIEQAANQLSLWLKGTIQEEITKMNTPPLKASTVAARKRQYKSKKKPAETISKPLVDTGYMFSSVQSRVTMK